MRVRFFLLLATCLAVACEPPRDARVSAPLTHDAADAAPSEPLDVSLDAGEPQEDASPDAGSISTNPTAPPVKPAWASGSVRDRLHALRVNDDNWARRGFVTWTTPTQVEALRASRVLLVATANMGGPPSPFVFLIGTLARKRGPTGALATLLANDPRFAKRRYAWSAGYATVLGLSGKRYGNELVSVRLREDALVVAITPEQKPPISVRDLSQREIPLERAIDEAARIGAVYHVRTGNDVPTRFREYVLVNEAMVERWALGTPDVHAEVDAEAALLGDLLTELASAPVEPKGGDPLAPWKRVEPASTLRALWKGTTAFHNDRYVLEPDRVRAAIDALGEYDRAAPELDVKR
jgi:hypothetical protein